MFREALTALAGLQVTGISANHDIDAVPNHLNRGQLPVLLVLPIENDSTQDRSLFKNRGGGFEAIAFADGARTATYAVTHLLLVAPIQAGAGIRSHLPALVDFIDAYFLELSDDVTLDGNLLEPAQVRVEPGVFAYGGVDYYGCAFRHTWVIQL